MDELTPRPIDKVGLALLRDGKLLLARSRRESVFQIPGGKVEPGDADDIAALVREIDEELCVALHRGTETYLGLFSAPAAGRPDLTVNVKLFGAEITGEPEPGREIEQLLWLDPFAVGDAEISDVVRHRILPFVRDMLAPHRG